MSSRKPPSARLLRRLKRYMKSLFGARTPPPRTVRASAHTLHGRAVRTTLRRPSAPKKAPAADNISLKESWLQHTVDKKSAVPKTADVITENDEWLSRVKMAGTASVDHREHAWELFQKYLPTFAAMMGRGEPQHPERIRSLVSPNAVQPAVPAVPAPVEQLTLKQQAQAQRVQEEKLALERAKGTVPVSSPAPAVQPAATLPAKAVASGKLLSPQEQPKKEPEPVRVVAKPIVRKKSTLHDMLAALNHIGLGKERMLFIQNLGTMLGAGLSLIEALRTLQLEARSKSMKNILKRIEDAVDNGQPLWRSMDDEAFFSPHAIALVRIGEEAGNLAQNMSYLAEQEEKDQALKSKVKMAMIYPTIVLVLMFIIVVGLGMFVLPGLIGVLTSLNAKLPFSTRMIILFTNAFTKYGAVFVPSSIAFFIAIVLLSKFTRFKVVTQWAMFRIPGIGQLAREATIARFGVILGGLLKAGVPVIEALQSLVEVTPIMAYRHLYEKILEHVSIGDSFGKSFSQIRGSDKLLPPSVQQLVMTGERSGALADIMLKIADIYDKKASDTAQKLPVILEPMLLLFIGGLVGTIAFSIIVPIYSIVGSVGQ